MTWEEHMNGLLAVAKDAQAAGDQVTFLGAMASVGQCLQIMHSLEVAKTLAGNKSGSITTEK